MTALARPAFDDLEAHVDNRRARVVAEKPAQDELRRATSDRGPVDAHGGKRGRGVSPEVEIAEANQRQLVGNAQATAARFLERAMDQVVRAAEDRGRSRALFEQGCETVSAQLFSAQDKIGVEEAQQVLKAWLK